MKHSELSRSFIAVVLPFWGAQEPLAKYAKIALVNDRQALSWHLSKVRYQNYVQNVLPSSHASGNVSHPEVCQENSTVKIHHLFSSSKNPLGILNVQWPDLCLEASIQCWLLCLEANMLMFTQHNFIPIQSSHPLKPLFHPGLQLHQLTPDPFNSITCKQRCIKSMTSLFSASRF